jgi:hypothetical protein
MGQESPNHLGERLSVEIQARELFPQATQILDRFHAKEHLSQMGKIIYPLHLEQSTSHALSKVPPTRLLHLDRRGGGRL